MQFAKMDDEVLADAFCDTFENCYDKDGNCSLYNAVKDNCRMYPNVKEWMAKEHLYGTSYDFPDERVRTGEELVAHTD